MNLSLQLKKNNDFDSQLKEDLLSKSLHEPLLMDDESLLLFQELNQIQKNLAEVVNSQQQKIDTIENNITQTEIESQKALKELKEADKLFFSYKPIFIGGIIGALVGGPVGAYAGIKWGGISGGVGSLVGSYTGYKVQKNA